MSIVVNVAREQFVELKDLDVTGMVVGHVVKDTLSASYYTLCTSDAVVDHVDVESVSGASDLRWLRGNHAGPLTMVITAAETIAAARCVTLLGVKADASDDTLPPVGVTILGAASADPCQVVTNGLAVGVLTAATPGDKYWLSETAGVLTATKPSAQNDALWLMGIAATATDLYVQIAYLGTVP